MDWIASIVDTLAFNYGWTKTYILDKVYLDEAIFYIKELQKRKINDYLVLGALILAPHTKKPQATYEKLQKELNQLEGSSIISTEPDQNATNKLKNLFGKYTKK